MQKILVVWCTVLVTSCQYSAEKAQQVVDKSILAHGQQKLNGVKLSFDFRDKAYSAERSGDSYTYSRFFIDSLELIEDFLVNSSDFVRLVNGDTVKLTDSMATKYSSSVNSVLYFVQLPYLLNDAAVVKSYEGTQNIKNALYDVIKVRFTQEDGGEDFSDEYRYWINHSNYLVDYMAYTYTANGGGIRFREAYNRMERVGIIFQDYINYEVPKGTPLADIPALFENGELKELSRINNENIKVTKN